MKKVLLLFALLIGALSASAVEVTYDFTPNTNSDKWPTEFVASETSYTSNAHSELTLTFYNSKWQKNTDKSYIATKKNLADAYVKILPIKNKVVKSVTLYLPSGVTAKSAFVLYIDGVDTELGKFTWSSGGTNSNNVTIPDDLQSSDNVLVIKTANSSNQCGFGKLILEVEDATQPTDPVEPDEPEAPSAPVFKVNNEVLSGDDVTLPYGTKITISAENATSLEVDVNDVVTTVEGNSTTITITEDVIISVVAKNGELTDKAEILVTVITPELTVKVGETVAENNGTYTIEQGTAIEVTATDAQSITILDKDANEVTLQNNCFYPMEDNEYMIEASAGEKSVMITIKVVVTASEYIDMTATYDFTTEGAYGLTLQNSSNSYEQNVKDINVNDVNLHFNQGKYRLWSSNSGCELRVYSDVSFTISVPSNCYITKIAASRSLTADPAGTSEDGPFTYDASSDVKAVTFTTTSSPKIKTITVSYTKYNYSAEGSITLAANHEYEKGTANVLTFKPTIKFNGAPIEDGYGEYTVLLNGVELGQADQAISHFAPVNGADNKFQLRKGTKVIDVDVAWPAAINAKPAIKGVRYVQNDDNTLDAVYNIAPEDETPGYSWLVNVSNEGAELGWTENAATCTFKNVGAEAVNAPEKINAALVIPFAVKSTDGTAALAEGDEVYDVVEYSAPVVELSTAEVAKPNESNTSGVADVAVDQNSAVEYYNLQGVRVNGDLTPGLYIRRQGNQATKVVVR